MSLLLDTSALSRVMQRDPTALVWLSRRRPGEVILSSPVAAEIRFGLERIGARTRRRALLEAEYMKVRRVVGWADWTESAALEFGRQKAKLFRKGQPVEDMDIAIGALAISLDAVLATCNARHFKRLGGLSLEDWQSPPT